MLSKFSSKRFGLLASSLALAFVIGACGGQDTATTDGSGDTGASTETASNSGGGSDLSGSIAVDGSSTVFPISEAMAEEFRALYPDVRTTVGVSGTGGGFEKFCAGETDISNASRPISEEEIQACADAGVEFVELPVAYDALSVVVNPENDWAECLTVAELQAIWAPDSTLSNWNQVRPDFPDQPMPLYGPGTDSGTFDYFTDAVNGEEGASRSDYTASEDDNVLVQGVEGDTGALGYFGYAYYEENQDALKAVAIDDEDPSNGEGCVAPSADAVNDGTYQPLARPIFIYVSTAALERPEVQEFISFYMDPANSDYVSETGYVAMPDDIYSKAQTRLEDRKTGSAFPGGSTVGVKLSEVL
ncbi:MAG: PstS family phosphate ABC transporter substrate-binding protein [Thainema sp.]